MKEMEDVRREKRGAFPPLYSLLIDVKRSPRPHKAPAPPGRQAYRRASHSLLMRPPNPALTGSWAGVVCSTALPACPELPSHCSRGRTRRRLVRATLVP